MKRILHDATYSDRILQMTADTMLLIDSKGICQDIATHSSLWFLQEDILLGKNIFEILPKHTYNKIYPEFKRVQNEKTVVNKNYKLPLEKETFYFKCVMYPLDDMVLCQFRDITERCNVRLELEKANQKLKVIQKSSLIGQWIYTQEDAMLEFYGYSNTFLPGDEIQRMPFKKYLKNVLEEDRKPLEEWLLNNAKTPEENSFEFKVYHNKQLDYLKTEKLVIKLNDDGSLDMIEGYTQNITDIKRREHDINILTRAINNATEDIFAAKKDGTLIFGNRKFKQHHRIPNYKSLSEIKVDQMPYGTINMGKWNKVFACTQTGSSKNFITYNPFPENKEILAFEETVYCVNSDTGEKSIWVFGRDVSERIKYESQVKRLNMIMDTTMKNLPASIVVKDVTNAFKYIYRNREANYKIIEDYNSSIGKSDFDYHPFEAAQQKRVEDMNVVKSKKEIHDIFESVDEHGMPIILDRRKFFIENKDFSPIIINIEWDITQQEMMKREILASKERAEMSDKLKSAFLANMSHEIRTPLNAIVGFSRIIADSDNTDERMEYYNIVEANNERLLQLINEILDLSKIESGIVEFTLDNVNLHVLCRETYDAHVFRCPKNVTLIFDESDPGLEITSDKNRIFQVLSNLIGNAFKFVKEGSVHYGYKKLGEFIFFYVKDTGIGISEDKVGQVFDRFVKVNNFAQGTGLGLAICRTIVERLGGTISVESKVGQGSTFTFCIPCQTPETDEEKRRKELEMEKIATKQDDCSNKERTTATILIAEDTDSNFDLLNAILGKTYNLLRAKDGVEAVQMYDKIRPDLILMDIKMPNMDGLSATKEIRKSSIDIPIIALSAYAYAYDREAANEAGCNEFLTKPISQTDLKETLNKWLSS
ncbi:PAS domain-containing hybrid sensor histidine kinase/response regulator [Bacteroides ihuae]|uniref:PAS domain-containing hybrid sensor histidine kinase/response regulator n=1 Tax=Bacteroides ihuae TaxID=1852362 RepID=UPI0008D8D852|nr:PAS domain-containing hybrid sensor histidine kinase/response regulator [Bacteroides ihuae]